MLFVLVFSTSAFGAGFGAAGCGPGSVLVSNENKKGEQLVAWYMNVQVFGTSVHMSAISTGTSNCGSSGLVLAQKEQQVFVKNNYNSLAKEMASGEGEGLDSLAGLLGCGPEQIEAFGHFTQKNYPSIFKNEETTPHEMLEGLKKKLRSEQIFSSSCHKL